MNTGEGDEACQGDAVHSRSILAGYEPDLINASKVLVIGAGALGQNVVQSLALSGIGSMLVVDPDFFEPHNATRSPFYPSTEQQAVFGLAKAPLTAMAALRVSTAVDAKYLWAAECIQRLGDAPIVWADIVVSAVDNINARAWLAERCKIHKRLMIEGGFFGPRFNLSLFGSRPEEPCYRCYNSSRISSGSCTRYALDIEARNLVPAIQSTACTLAGLLSEHAIQALHGSESIAGKRFYGDIRRMLVWSADLRRRARCPAQHSDLPHLGSIEAGATLADIGKSLADKYGAGELGLSEPFHLRYSCVRCGQQVAVGALESVWLADSRCDDCGGSWPRSSGNIPISAKALAVPTDTSEDSPFSQVSTKAVGLNPGGAAVYQPYGNQEGLVTIAGELADNREINILA